MNWHQTIFFLIGMFTVIYWLFKLLWLAIQPVKKVPNKRKPKN